MCEYIPAETQNTQGCGKEYNGFLAPMLLPPLRYTEGGIMSEAKKRKQYEELDFTDDFMFCKILQSDKNLCKELTELILSRKIGEILQVDSQKPIEITADGKGIRFDVYMEDDESTVYDIEMQTTTYEDLPKRMRYYQSMIDLNLIERGAKYKELKKSYIIFICLENPYSESGLHKYSFKTVCVEDPFVEFQDDLFKIILSAEGDKSDVSDEMGAFLSYLSDKKAYSDFTKRLHQRVLAAREHVEWRREYMTLLERDERMREEGREEVRKEAEKRVLEAEEKKSKAEEKASKAEEKASKAEEKASKAEEKALKAEKEIVITEEIVIRAIRDKMNSDMISATEAMDKMNIPAELREKYTTRLV